MIGDRQSHAARFSGTRAYAFTVLRSQWEKVREMAPARTRSGEMSRGVCISLVAEQGLRFPRKGMVCGVHRARSREHGGSDEPLQGPHSIRTRAMPRENGETLRG